MQLFWRLIAWIVSVQTHPMTLRFFLVDVLLCMQKDHIWSSKKNFDFTYTFLLIVVSNLRWMMHHLSTEQLKKYVPSFLQFLYQNSNILNCWIFYHGLIKTPLFLCIFFLSEFFFRIFMIYRTAGEGRIYFFSSSITSTYFMNT